MTVQLQATATEHASAMSDAEADVLAIAAEVKLSSVDGIFGCFLDTNMHMRRHLTESEIMHTTATPWKGDFARYEHFGEHYLATLFEYKGPDARTVNVKLSSNGFVFPPLIGAKKYPHVMHKRRDWLLVPPALHDEFPRVKNFMRTNSLVDMQIFYHSAEQRMNIWLYPRDGATTPQVLITFERGDPYVDQRSPW